MTNKKDPETSATSIYDAFDPVETDVAIHKPHNIKECYEVFAKNNMADRDFCIEHTSTKDDRKQCLDNVRLPIDRAFCETFNLNDADAKYACLEGILDENGNQIDYKAEYCYWNYF